MIAFYISSHGFGHLTRCMAIIDELLLYGEHRIYVASGKKQIDFAKIYYKVHGEKIIFAIVETDIGIINKEKSLEVDIVKTNMRIREYIKSSEEIIASETKKIKELNVKLIISDISVIGFYISKILNVKSLGISNFTWLDQYKYFGIDEKSLKFYEDGYKKCCMFFRYPLSLELNGIESCIEDIGFVAREIIPERVYEIKEKYGKFIVISLGKSAELETIKINGYKGLVMFTEGVNISKESMSIGLPTDIVDTQNYIAAAELVIAKAGWGIVSECSVSGVKTVLIERKSVIEDSKIIEKLKQNKGCISLREDELKEINIEKIFERFETENIIESKHKNQRKEIAQKIFSFIN